MVKLGSGLLIAGAAWLVYKIGLPTPAFKVTDAVVDQTNQSAKTHGMTDETPG